MRAQQDVIAGELGLSHSLDDWAEILNKRWESLKAGQPSPKAVRESALLGQLMERCSSDRTGAVGAYLWAWRAQRDATALLRRARTVCSSDLGDFATLAKLLHQEAALTNDARVLRAEGIAWIDAGKPDRAVKPLLAASRSLGDDLVTRLSLGVARSEWPHPGREIQRLESDAEAAGDASVAARYYLTALRVARLTETEPATCERLLLAAFELHIGTEVIALAEDWYGRLDVQRLAVLYRAAIARLPGPAAKVEMHRRAGCRLIRTSDGRGAGMALLQEGLELAYEHFDQLPSGIPGHIASLAALSTGLTELGAEQRFMRLVDGGLACQLPTLDLLFAATRALVAALASKAEDSAGVYGALIQRLEPGHPMLSSLPGTVSRAVAASGLADAPVSAQAAPPTATETDGTIGLDFAARTDVDYAANTGSALSAAVFGNDTPEAEPVEGALELDLQSAGAQGAEPMTLDLEGDEGVAAARPPAVPPPLPKDVFTAPAAVAPAAGPAGIIPASALAALKEASDQRDATRQQFAADGGRAAPRTETIIDVDVVVGERRFAAIVRDLSTSGVYLATEESLDAGAELQITLSFDSAGTPVRITVDAVVARTDARGAGCRLVDPPDEYAAQVARLID